MTGESEPLLSIGMPVYNGEHYIAAALGALIDQTFTDFELIVSDNASTDRTMDIVEAFAAADPRIRIHQFDENEGAAINYNKTVELARGRYFKWAAHDDVCAPTFLEKCIDVLEEEPDVVLCGSQSAAIDENGQVKGNYGEEKAFDQYNVIDRFWTAISVPHVCIVIFGVMRLDILKKTPMHGEYVGADRNLLAEFSLMGKVRLLSATLFFRRDHAEASISKHQDERERLAWFNPAYRDKKSYPTWKRLKEYSGSINRVALPFLTRVGCYWKLGCWILARHHTGARNFKLLAKEIF